MRPKGRGVALGIAAVGAGTIALAAFLARARIVEEWWIHRLGSADDAVRLQAAGKLAEMKSLRAVPRRIRIIERDERECSCDPMPKVAHFALCLTPIAFRLYEIGDSAIPLLENVLRQGNDFKEGRLFKTLGDILSGWGGWEAPLMIRVDYK